MNFCIGQHVQDQTLPHVLIIIIKYTILILHNIYLNQGNILNIFVEVLDFLIMNFETTLGFFNQFALFVSSF